MAFNYFIDLTTRPPRSARVRLGGYVILPRMLDKGRALIAGKNGEYNFDCSLDNHFLSFTGIKGSEIKKLLEEGKSDSEVLEWIKVNAPFKRGPHEVDNWSNYFEKRAPADVEGREYLHGLHKKIALHRGDITTWFDLLDLDDYVTFGGKA